MKIFQEISDLSDFETWSGATRTKEIICDAGEGEEFISALEEHYPTGIGEEDLNDLLWFEPEWCLDLVGPKDEDDEDEDDEDEDGDDPDEDLDEDEEA